MKVRKASFRSAFAWLAAAALALGTYGRVSAVVLDCAAKGALEDNFSTWSGGRATASVVEDDGHRFLRIESDPTRGTVQYRGCRVDGSFPGFYRLRIKARNRGGRPDAGGGRSRLSWPSRPLTNLAGTC